jgi:hypothetical protein
VFIRLTGLVIVAVDGPEASVQVVSRTGCPGFAAATVPVRVIEFCGREIVTSVVGDVFPDTVGWAIARTERRMDRDVKSVFMMFGC